jgi:hypothetical protein
LCKRGGELPGWRSAGLGRLLAPMRGSTRALGRAGALAPDLPRAQASLAVRPEALAGPQCNDLRRAVETFVADTGQGEPAASPFLHDDPALARCLGVDVDALRSTRLVALRADHVEELFVAVATPDFAAITWLQPRDALAFGRHRFFVVAALPGAPMLAVARLANTEVPAVWRDSAEFQDSCRLVNQACFALDFEDPLSYSGLRQTTRTGFQLRAFPDQRSGWRRRAAS